MAQGKMTQHYLTHDEFLALTGSVSTANGILIAQALKLIAPEKVGEFAASLPGLAARVGASDPVAQELLEQASIGVLAFVRNES